MSFAVAWIAVKAIYKEGEILVLVKPIRRIAAAAVIVVSPRVRFRRDGPWGKQTTSEARLLVPVLVECFLCCPSKARKRHAAKKRKASAAAPFAREVPCVDLLEDLFLRVWEFFVNCLPVVAF